MANDIVQARWPGEDSPGTLAQRLERPKAIAKEKGGIVLYWVEELGIAGIHIKGIMRLLNTGSDLVHNVVTSLEAGRQINVLEAEIITESGLKTVRLIAEDDLGEVLEAISLSKAKSETRKSAMQVMKRLASAGFKLMVMLELAPQQLKAQVDRHVTDLDKALEIEQLRCRTQEIHASMLTMHGSAWLALQGVGVAEVKTVVTEVVQPETNRSTEILSADQLKQAVKGRTGQRLKSQAEFIRKLKAAGRDDLLVPVTRNTTAEYVIPARLDEAIGVVFAASRQKLIGE